MATQTTTSTSWFDRLTTRLWPELADASEEARSQGRVTLGIILVNLPLVVLALVWQLAVTDLDVIRSQWPLLLFILVVLLLIQRQEFVVVLEISQSNQLPITSSLGGMMQWAAVLMLGPTAAWLLWLTRTLTTVSFRWFAGGRDGRPAAVWGPLAALAQEVGPSVLSLLCAAWAYEALGGVYPLAATNPADWLPAAAATFVKVAATLFWLLPTMLVINRLLDPAHRSHIIRRLWTSALAFMLLTYPFSIPLALTYGQGGVWLFVATSLGVLLANWLAHHLSRANLRAQLRARELAELERQGADLLAAPADASTLPSIIARHLPLLFPYYRCEVRLFEQDGAGSSVWPAFAAQHPAGEVVAAPADWQALMQSAENEMHFPARGDGDPFLQDWAGISLKILGRTGGSDEAQPVLGGIYLEYSDERPADDLMQSMQELANQIAAAIARAENYANNLARLRLTHELETAGRIQASFLPDAVPQLPGYDIAATLVPARQTAGDFYDFVALPDGRLGIVVADVSDKGTGAALYMALTRTLLRTYAFEYPEQPELVLKATNERILADTNSDEFVTVFYGVLEPESGSFCYANAGHNPAFFLSEETSLLGKTGIPLGMFAGMNWSRRDLRFYPGDMLCAYSDGITEAPGPDASEFGEDRLLSLLESGRSGSAAMVQQAAITAVESWTKNDTQFDDITILVLRRHP